MISKIKNKLNGDIHLKELLKGSFIAFALKMLGTLLGYALIFLISNKTGAEGVGLFNVMNQILLILGMTLGLGMNVSVLRYAGQFNNLKDQSKMHLLFKYFMHSVAPVSVTGGLLLFFCSDHLALWLNKGPEYAIGFKCVGITLPFYTITQICIEFIRGLKKIKISELLRSVLRPTLMTLGILIFYNDSLTKIDVIYLLGISILFDALITGFSINKFLKLIPKSKVEFSKKKFLKTSYPMMGVGISAMLLNASPIFFIDILSSQKDTGIYTVVFKIASITSLILVIVNTIAAPQFSELFWSKKKMELQQLISQTTKIMFYVALFFCVLIIALSSQILLFFGEDFIDGKIALIILISSQLINSSTGSVGVIMNMSGNQRAYRVIIILTLLFQLILLYFFVQKLSITGAALSVAISTILLNVSLVIFVKKKLDLKTSYPI
tara:strand:- start:4425 stop:5738 length:1314 start_codon:yes stop_codon:yes gene_type:complete